MADTNTTNYDLVKPEINGSPNTWGNKLNGDMDIIDENLHRVDVLAGDAVLRAGSGSDPTKYVRAVIKYQEGVVPTTDRDLVHYAYLKSYIQNASPRGSIITWGGTLASIPNGFALCDGSIQNGIQTPDLRNRFVWGAGSGAGFSAPGSYGGSYSHNHGGAVGGTVLAEWQIPSHTHGVGDPGHTHGIADPGHSHYYADAGNGVIQNGAIPPAYTNSAAPGETNKSTAVAGTGIGIYSAATGIWIGATGGNGSHNHTIATSDHMPPFYALAYLIRVKYPWE